MSNEHVFLYGADGEELEPKRKTTTWVWSALSFFVAMTVVFTYLNVRQYFKHKDKSESMEISTTTGFTVTTTSAPDALWLELPVPKDHPPHRIKIGPDTFFVEYTDARSLASMNALAMTDLNAHIIWLNPERTMLRSDLMHELMHCAVALQTHNHRLAVQYWDAEESNIQQMDVALLTILNDNPDVVSWMMRRRGRRGASWRK